VISLDIEFQQFFLVALLCFSLIFYKSLSQIVMMVASEESFHRFYWVSLTPLTQLSFGQTLPLLFQKKLLEQHSVFFLFSRTLELLLLLILLDILTTTQSNNKDTSGVKYFSFLQQS
jgi:hypothetical protein